MPAALFARLALLLLSVFGTAACGLEHRTTSSRPAPTTLLVENRSANDVVVYLADGHAPLRLGRVTALSQTRLAIPAHNATSGVRLLVRSAGSVDAYVDEPVVIGSGGTLELTVQPLLGQSTLGVLSFGR